jgi:hypothetical protein
VGAGRFLLFLVGRWQAGSFLLRLHPFRVLLSVKYFAVEMFYKEDPVAGKGA